MMLLMDLTLYGAVLVFGCASKHSKRCFFLETLRWLVTWTGCQSSIDVHGILCKSFIQLRPLSLAGHRKTFILT